jgi:hypothetical protein
MTESSSCPDPDKPVSVINAADNLIYPNNKSDMIHGEGIIG